VLSAYIYLLPTFHQARYNTGIQTHCLHRL
jgi:hypothetical protein